MISLGRSPTGLIIACVFAFAAIGIGIPLWKGRLDRRLEETSKRVSDLYYHQFSAEEYTRIKSDTLAVTQKALSRPSLREQARQTRIWLFITTLDALALEHEIANYQAEQRHFSNKDPLFQAGQVLYDLWSVPTPDRVEQKRVELLRWHGLSFHDVDWYRPLRLKTFAKGKALYSQGKYEEALVAFHETVESIPTFSRAWYFRGRTNFELQKFQEAVASFREAARLDTSRPETYLWMGITSVKLGRIGEAVEAFRNALVRDGDYTEAREQLDSLESER